MCTHDFSDEFCPWRSVVGEGRKIAWRGSRRGELRICPTRWSCAALYSTRVGGNVSPQNKSGLRGIKRCALVCYAAEWPRQRSLFALPSLQRRSLWRAPQNEG